MRIVAVKTCHETVPIAPVVNLMSFPASVRRKLPRLNPEDKDAIKSLLPASHRAAMEAEVKEFERHAAIILPNEPQRSANLKGATSRIWNVLRQFDGLAKNVQKATAEQRIDAPGALSQLINQMEELNAKAAENNMILPDSTLSTMSSVLATFKRKLPRMDPKNPVNAIGYVAPGARSSLEEELSKMEAKAKLTTDQKQSIELNKMAGLLKSVIEQMDYTTTLSRTNQAMKESQAEGALSQLVEQIEQLNKQGGQSDALNSSSLTAFANLLDTLKKKLPKLDPQNPANALKSVSPQVRAVLEQELADITAAAQKIQASNPQKAAKLNEMAALVHTALEQLDATEEVVESTKASRAADPEGSLSQLIDDAEDLNNKATQLQAEMPLAALNTLTSLLDNLKRRLPKLDPKNPVNALSESAAQTRASLQEAVDAIEVKAKQLEKTDPEKSAELMDVATRMKSMIEQVDSTVQAAEVAKATDAEGALSELIDQVEELKSRAAAAEALDLLPREVSFATLLDTLKKKLPGLEPRKYQEAISQIAPQALATLEEELQMIETQAAKLQASNPEKAAKLYQVSAQIRAVMEQLCATVRASKLAKASVMAADPAGSLSQLIEQVEQCSKNASSVADTPEPTKARLKECADVLRNRLPKLDPRNPSAALLTVSPNMRAQLEEQLAAVESKAALLQATNPQKAAELHKVADQIRAVSTLR